MIAFVQSCWHRDIVDRSRDGFAAALTDVGPTVEYHELPGAFELPLHTRLLADTGRYVAVAVAGLVVDGGIYRHEFVASAVIDGLMRVQLETNVPVFSGVLTPQHFDERDETQLAFFMTHMYEKGIELAHACRATLAARKALVSPG
ncbi:MAG TPA: 6,7-dimethyl-8-ribityllumazine synthase [Acidimicrobiales bacterium]|nr:6,7-dimethyl-8-ribityllumazine synthase [Acidimicrobiales bacterium]